MRGEAGGREEKEEEKEEIMPGKRGKGIKWRLASFGSRQETIYLRWMKSQMTRATTCSINQSKSPYQVDKGKQMPLPGR